jgi:hypothetical protein
MTESKNRQGVKETPRLLEYLTTTGFLDLSSINTIPFWKHFLLLTPMATALLLSCPQVPTHLTGQSLGAFLVSAMLYNK